MRNLVAATMFGAAALLAGGAVAADLPAYTPPPPPVDNGLGGTFYLRASVGLNSLWGHDVNYLCGCGGVTTTYATGAGYGYSFGAGFGYEAGNGLRGDLTLDRLNNNGLTDGTLTVNLRSTIALANAYYDFGLGSLPLGGYVGAGLGGAYNETHITGPGAGPDGSSFTAAGALMAGVTYDMGSMVADLGYRMIYMPEISNGSPALSSGVAPFYINHNIINEVRGTLRYRFN